MSSAASAINRFIDQKDPVEDTIALIIGKLVHTEHQLSAELVDCGRTLHQ